MARVARLRPVLQATALVGLTLLTACDLPEAPEWEVGAILPFSSDPLTIVDFLPVGVDTATVGGQSVFTLSAEGGVYYTLGGLCNCGVPNGTTANVPALDYRDSLDVRFPDDLVSVELYQARIAISADNNLGFDPLRRVSGPDSAFVSLTAVDLASGATLGSLMLTAASDSLPPGPDAARVELDVSNFELADGFRVHFHLFSPDDGQPVELYDTLGVNLSSALNPADIAAVTVVVNGATLEETFVVDFDDNARSEVAERVESASYEFELIHTAEIEGSMQISIAGSEVDLFSGDPSREVALPGLTFTPNQVQTGVMSAEDIRLIANFPEVFVGYRGVASGTRAVGGQANLSRFTPAHSLRTRLKVTSRIRIGGE